MVEFGDFQELRGKIVLGVVEFGDYHEMFGWGQDGQIYLQEYPWRDRMVVAAYRLHASGRELIGVLRTPYRAAQPWRMRR
jgi:hypothetical protein